MNYDLLDILREVVETYDITEDIETKILEDIDDEIRQLLYERASTIDTLADMWGDDDEQTEY